MLAQGNALVRCATRERKPCKGATFWVAVSPFQGFDFYFVPAYQGGALG